MVLLVLTISAGSTEGEPLARTATAPRSLTTTTRNKRNLFKQDSLAQREGETRYSIVHHTICYTRHHSFRTFHTKICKTWV